MLRNSRFVAALAACVLISPRLEAVNFCVGDTAELRAALQTAASNGEDDQIRIRIGTYRATSGASVASFSTAQSNALTVRGGYIDLAMIDCAGVVNDPTLTIIDGEDVRSGLRLLGLSGATADLSVQNLTITRGIAAEAGGGLEVGGTAGFSGDVLIDRVLLRDNVALIGGALAGSTGGTYTVRNSVLRGNVGTNSTGGISLTVNHTDANDYRVWIGGNTFVDNACDSGPSCTAALRVGGSARAAVFNNAFVLSGGVDVAVSGPGPLYLLNNNLLNWSGAPTVQTGNLALADPSFVDLLGGDFRLADSSPLREAGTGAFDLGALDFRGRPRLNDAQYDIGAFENDRLVFRSGFETLQ
jgi:hypothetical protein